MANISAHPTNRRVTVVGMLIAEELLLLALESETGRKRVRGDSLEPAVAGLLVAELALLERVGITPREAGWNKRGRITIIDPKPTDDPMLDLMLQRLVAAEGKKLKDALSPSVLGKRLGKDVIPQLLERLAARGVLTPHRDKVLGLFPRTSWPQADPHAEEDVRRRLQAALVGGVTPTERTTALIAMLAAIGRADKVVTGRDRRSVRRRAKELSEGDWAAKAVKDAIAEAAAAASGAATAGAAGDGGSG